MAFAFLLKDFSDFLRVFFKWNMIVCSLVWQMDVSLLSIGDFIMTIQTLVVIKHTKYFINVIIYKIIYNTLKLMQINFLHLYVRHIRKEKLLRIRPVFREVPLKWNLLRMFPVALLYLKRQQQQDTKCIWSDNRKTQMRLLQVYWCSWRGIYEALFLSLFLHSFAWKSWESRLSLSWHLTLTRTKLSEYGEQNKLNENGLLLLSQATAFVWICQRAEKREVEVLYVRFMQRYRCIFM